MTAVTRRQDAHSPTNFDPTEYEYVASFYQGASDEAHDTINDEETDAALAEWEKHGWKDGNYGTKGSCDHCGARFSYGMLMRHVPTRTMIAVGSICASERFSLPSRAAFDTKALKDAAKAARERKGREQKIAQFLLAHEGLAEALETDHYIVEDIKRRLQRYAEISEKQVALVHKLAAEVAEEQKKIESGEVKAPGPVPTGKGITIEGVLVTEKWVDGYAGERVHKMLIESDDGWKVWGTKPAVFDTPGHWDYPEGGERQWVPNPLAVEKGDRVKFVAEVEVKRGEPTFGFFKRPHKAERIETEETK